MDITLVQPRHVYAPNNNDRGHLYMPTALLSVAARFLSSGARVRIVDENFSRAQHFDAVLGVNVIGPPYVERTIELLDRHRFQFPEGLRLVGGQGVRGFQPKQLSALFGKSIIHGNDAQQLENALNFGCIPHASNTSLIPAYKLLPDSLMKLYLASEFCFFLSQGCKYKCTFCAAERSHSGGEAGSHRLTESYRNLETAYDDLLFLCQTALRLGIHKLSLYLSNLDLFQTPELLRQFAEVVLNIQKTIPSVQVRMRGLATVSSFLMCHHKNTSVIKKIADAGLERVGFGIDGATPAVWKSVKKPQHADDCIKAIDVASNQYDLIPESLMVFGHNEADDESSLNAAIQFIDETRIQYNAVPRPHVAKNVIPGNDGWLNPKSRPIVDWLISNPSAFQMLDFTALPSWLTHPNPVFRAQVTNAFLAICNFKDSLTQYTLPEDPSRTAEELAFAKSFNVGKYDV